MSMVHPPKGRFQAIAVAVHWLISLTLKLLFGPIISNVMKTTNYKNYYSNVGTSGITRGQGNIVCYISCHVITHLNTIH